MRKQLNIEFHSMEAGPGVVDIAIRYDTKTGRFNYMLEENGLPTTLPTHIFSGIIFNIASVGVAEAYGPSESGC